MVAVTIAPAVAMVRPRMSTTFHAQISTQECIRVGMAMIICSTGAVTFEYDVTDFHDTKHVL